MRVLPLLGSAMLAVLPALKAASFPIGINVGHNADYTPMFPFADAIKNARGWARIDKRYEPGGVTLDPHGWPTEDAAIVINASVPGLAGTYRLRFRGQARVTAPDGGAIEDLNFDAAAGLSTATLRVPTGQSLLSLAFQETSGGVSHVELIRDLPSEGPFTKAFLENLAPYRTLRFMDWMRINGSKQVAWSDRSTPETAIWTRPHGVPVEICIDLCNRLQADAWFCIPHLADDNYVREFARLVKSRLDPKLHVYIEYSNELWNFQFPQTSYFKALATEKFEAMVRAGEADESRRNQTLYPILWDLESARAAGVLRTFRDAFGDNDRLIPVIGSQSANAFITKSYLRSGVLKGLVEAVAIAPYFGHSLGSKNEVDRTLAEGLDGLFIRLAEEIETNNLRHITANAEIAAEHQLLLLGYEGGQHLAAASGDKEKDARLNELFILANRDARMGELYLKSAANWEKANGGLFVYYNQVSNWGPSGYWGLVENMDQTNSPKLNAVKSLATPNSSLPETP